MKTRSARKAAPKAKSPITWDAASLLAKAKRYAEEARGYDSDGWQYALWASLSLELLARAALAKVSPALLAEVDSKHWSSLYHSLGFTVTEEKFQPKSIGIADVFRRLAVILKEFKELENFGIQFTGMRNAELHSGELAFDGIAVSSWQHRFYKSCDILLKSMGKALEDFVDEKEAKAARKIIAAAADEGAKAVKGDVTAHHKVWTSKTEQERKTLREQAEVWATRQEGHRVDCPACGSRSLVVGDPIDAANRKLKEDLIIETQEFLPNRFECVACGLKISGLSRLQAVGLSDRYKRTYQYDAAEYYAPEDEYEGWEDDNNEY